jgi:5-enolpyruvylshikimate-3-phosphate synthase
VRFAQSTCYSSAMAPDGVMVHPSPRVRPPGDMSISHRYALLAFLTEGTSAIRDAGAADASDPEFFHVLESLRA